MKKRIRKLPKVLVTVDPARASGRDFIAGVADYSKSFGPWQFQWEPDGLQGLSGHWRNHDFDGVIMRDLPEIDPLIESGLPAVVLLHKRADVAGAICVDTDDRGLSVAAARHFLQRGFRHFAFVGRVDGFWSVNREVEFSKAVEAAGHTVDTFQIPISEGVRGDSRFMQDQLRPWFKSLPKPLALMGANDGFARLVLDLCELEGLKVPEDCAVLGVGDDAVLCELCHKPLTSIQLGFRRSGYQAAASLDAWMRRKVFDCRHISVRVRNLVTRQSSDVFAIKDTALTKALHYMMANVDQPICVDAVASYAGLSKRVLERRFKGYANTSIIKYHRKMRVQRIAQILSTGNAGLEQIAEHFGFTDSAHLSKVFKANMGESPSQYRKRFTTPLVGES